MSRYLAARAAQTAVTLVLMSFVVYVLIGLMPGDPIDMMIAGDPQMTSADAARLRAVYGLDKPLFERYLAWALQALQGNFGYSRSFAQPVLSVLWPRLLNTVVLAGTAFVLATAIALPLGIWAATRPRSRTDYLINLLCFAGISAPPFWLALLFITFFATSHLRRTRRTPGPARYYYATGTIQPALSNERTSTKCPAIPAAAAIAGLTKWVRPSLP